MSNPEEFASLNAAVVERELAQADQDQVGAGVLVHRLRSSERAGRARKAATLTEREAEYGRSIAAFLNAAFPEFGTHPAAVATVIRLHHLHGRKGLTTGEYRPFIQAAVEAWEERWAA